MKVVGRKGLALIVCDCPSQTNPAYPSFTIWFLRIFSLLQNINFPLSMKFYSLNLDLNPIKLNTILNLRFAKKWAILFTLLSDLPLNRTEIPLFFRRSFWTLLLRFFHCFLCIKSHLYRYTWPWYIGNREKAKERTEKGDEKHIYGNRQRRIKCLKNVCKWGITKIVISRTF